jgi:hypothetical protein
VPMFGIFLLAGFYGWIRGGQIFRRNSPESKTR